MHPSFKFAEHAHVAKVSYGQMLSCGRVVTQMGSTAVVKLEPSITEKGWDDCPDVYVPIEELAAIGRITYELIRRGMGLTDTVLETRPPEERHVTQD